MPLSTIRMSSSPAGGRLNGGPFGDLFATGGAQNAGFRYRLSVGFGET